MSVTLEEEPNLAIGSRFDRPTAQLVKAVLVARGPVVTTCHTRDALDATRDARAAAGPVWVFDPQQVTQERATWWWNPLSSVTDAVSAAQLTRYFARGSSAVEVVRDPLVERSGRGLLAASFLAAALGRRPIRDVTSWLEDVADEPVDLLRSGGHPGLADAVLDVMGATEMIRDSVYAAARAMSACLKEPGVADWVNARGRDDVRPQFDPHGFATGTGTLYSLSRRGAGTADPLVIALTAAILDAATELMDLPTGSGLHHSLTDDSSESVDVYRWRDLFGTTADSAPADVPAVNVFQAWSHGAALFGEKKMMALSVAANGGDLS